MGSKNHDFSEDKAKKRKGGDARRFFEEQLS